MTEYINNISDGYLVVHNGNDTYILIMSKIGNYTETKLPYIEFYSTIEEAYVAHGDNLPPLEIET